MTKRRIFTIHKQPVVFGVIGFLVAAMVVVLSGCSEQEKNESQEKKGEERTELSLSSRAEIRRARDLVMSTATALQTLIANGVVPNSLLTASRGEGVLDERGAACLAVKKLMSLSYRTSEEDGETVYRLTGNDRFGLVTPWATDVLKKLPQGQGDSAKVPSGGTVRDHRLHFAIDDDGDGVTEARLGSRTVKVRKTAVVWCWGKNGKEDDYEMSMGGKGDADDIYSWSKDQEVRQ